MQAKINAALKRFGPSGALDNKAESSEEESIIDKYKREAEKPKTQKEGEQGIVS
jgi:hypothetical protein